MSVKVGDIVKTKEKDGNSILPAVVTKVSMSGTGVEVLFADGTYGHRTIKRVEVTDRHIDMQSVLDSIK